MAIQSNETLVTKGDLKELYQDKILPYLGGNMMMATNVSDYYNEDEKVVGVWTDGKPLYQKIIIDTMPKVTTAGTYVTKNVVLDIDNIDLIFLKFSFMIDPNSITRPMPYTLNSGYQSKVSAAKTYLQVASAITEHSQRPFYAIIQYTKTTDAANSAAATPGCYDLNRPDLWPGGKEIFFGNGLYGKRFMGTFTTANIWTDYLVQLDTIDRGRTLKIINRGGGIGRRNGDTYMPLGMQDTLEYDVWYASSLSGQTAGFRLRGKDNGTHSCSYDIWVTYTK